ncbi:DNA-binding domain-containing protein [Thioclava atlantica]|uniref:Putative DNA-binding domain-containing protein n=1 Tax=Thioclava atlantica TaxID=1317124 RepID=A0A085TWV9_9RHOB|nr:DNA-binding domain-containing protein [Thioclava atlantica]KFE35206.1 hypothetical protein DW2_09531 [Thioclava atlantica]
MRSHRKFARNFLGGISGGPVPEGATSTAPSETEHRFRVYRNNVAHGLSRALARHYPVVERLVGPECFAGLAALYIERHPPRTPILTEWGGRFALFLAETETLSDLPYLPDIARIEWARSRAYHAQDAAPLRPEDLRRFAERIGEGLQLYLHPSTQILQLATPAGSIWASQQPDGPRPPAPDQWCAETVLVARRGIAHVITVVITPATGRFLAHLMEGANVAEAHSHAGDGFDLNAAFALLLENALIVGAGHREDQT